MNCKRMEKLMVTHVRSYDNLADMLTKALPASSVKKFRYGIGMRRLREERRIGGEHP